MNLAEQTISYLSNGATSVKATTSGQFDLIVTKDSVTGKLFVQIEHLRFASNEVKTSLEEVFKERAVIGINPIYKK